MKISKNAMPMALAIAALFFAVLLPPEAYGDGKLAVILCATFAFLAALGEGQVPSRYVWTGIAAFVLLTGHSLWISVDLYRSLDFLTVLWAYFCLAGLFLYSSASPAKPVAVAMVVLAAILSGYGLYQFFFGFETLERLIMHSGSTEIVKEPALAIVAERRIFSTLALPGTLWGLLVMALPFHAALRSRRRGINVLLAALAALSLTAGYLTRSFGLLAGLAAATACWMFTGNARAAWRRALIVLVAAGASGVLFYSARRAAIAAQDPMALRFLNWVSAWSVFSTHPLGTGLGTYGIVYTQHMMPTANETQYAHNTALQLLAELGFPFLIAAAVFAILLVRRPRPRGADPIARATACAVAVWLAHNLIDIDVYFPSVGVVGVVLAAVWFRGAREVPLPVPDRRSLAAAAVMGVLVLAFSALAMVSGELQHRAQSEYAEKKPLVAVATLDLAKTLMPLNSSLFHDSGEILLDLSQKSHEPKYLDAASAAFQRAITLSPQKVGPHIGYGLCLSSMNRLDAAIAEIAVARKLYPHGAYAQSIDKLMHERMRMQAR